MVVGIQGKLASLAALLLLGGCLSVGGEAPDQLFSLKPQSTAPAGPMASGTIQNAIVVLDPDTERRLDVNRVPVQVNASTVAYLKDATWVERPARQFRRLLAETIRTKTGRLVVEGSDYEVTGKTFLSGRLIDLGYDARSQSAVVRYDAIREEADGQIHTRRFEAEIVGVPAKAAAVAPALNDAANQVAGEVAEWVSG